MRWVTVLLRQCAGKNDWRGTRGLSSLTATFPAHGGGACSNFVLAAAAQRRRWRMLQSRRHTAAVMRQVRLCSPAMRIAKPGLSGCVLLVRRFSCSRTTRCRNLNLRPLARCCHTPFPPRRRSSRPVGRTLPRIRRRSEHPRKRLGRWLLACPWRGRSIPASIRPLP